MIRIPGRRRRGAITVALLLLLNAAVADVTPLPRQPLTNEDIVRLVINGTEERVILEEIASRPVDFDLDEEIVVELRLVGVNDRLIEAMRVRQRDMPVATGGAEPAGGDRGAAAGYLVVALNDDRTDSDGKEATPFAIRALPEGVKRPPGMEVGRVSDLAIAVLCRTPDHVPDHWDIRSPIEQAPRHGVLFFQAASRPDKVKRFEILRLDLTSTPPIEVAPGRHSLIIALAGRSAGSGAWHLLASDPVEVDVPAAATLRLSLIATSTLQGNRMAGYGIEHQWKVGSGAKGGEK